MEPAVSTPYLRSQRCASQWAMMWRMFLATKSKLLRQPALRITAISCRTPTWRNVWMARPMRPVDKSRSSLLARGPGGDVVCDNDTVKSHQTIAAAERRYILAQSDPPTFAPSRLTGVATVG